MTICNIVRASFIGAALSVMLTGAVSGAQPFDEKLKVPALNLKSPAGESVPLAASIGKKPVLVVFWASWCTICNDEIPLLKKLNADRFKVIAVNEGESAWKTKRFISANGIDYQVVLDPDGLVAKSFQVPGVPACTIIGKSGLVDYRGIGLPENIDSYAVK